MKQSFQRGLVGVLCASLWLCGCTRRVSETHETVDLGDGYALTRKVVRIRGVFEFDASGWSEFVLRLPDGTEQIVEPHRASPPHELRREDVVQLRTPDGLILAIHDTLYKQRTSEGFTGFHLPVVDIKRVVLAALKEHYPQDLEMILDNGHGHLVVLKDDGLSVWWNLEVYGPNYPYRFESVHSDYATLIRRVADDRLPLRLRLEIVSWWRREGRIVLDDGSASSP